MKNNQKKRTFSKLLAGIVLALGLIIGVNAAPFAGANAATKKSKTEQQVTTPTKKELRSLAKKIVKANQIEKLIKKHGSVLAYNNGWIVYADKECSYTRTDEYTYSSYADKDTSYTLSWGDEPEGYYTLELDKNADMYDATHARYYIEGNLSADMFAEDEVVTLEEKDGTIILIGKMNEKESQEVIAGWKLDVDTEHLYYRTVIDAKSYEILSSDLYAENDENNILHRTSLIYGLEDKLGECYLLRAMASRTEMDQTTCTVIIDPGTENEYTKKITVSRGEPLYFISTEVEEVTYKNAKCTKKIKEWNTETDITLYVKTKKT